MDGAWRQERREALLARRAALGEAVLRKLSQAAIRQIESALAGHWSRRFGLYWPRRDEIGLFPLVRRIVEAGGVAALRAPPTGNGLMQFRAWTPGDPLASGDDNVSFPRDGPLVTPDIVFAPVVGFDGENFRLGHGGGSYGRLLACIPRPLCIGVGFEFMRLASVRPPAREIPLDLVVTEAGAFPRGGLRASIEQPFPTGQMGRSGPRGL